MTTPIFRPIFFRSGCGLNIEKLVWWCHVWKEYTYRNHNQTFCWTLMSVFSNIWLNLCYIISTFPISVKHQEHQQIVSPEMYVSSLALIYFSMNKISVLKMQSSSCHNVMTSLKILTCISESIPSCAFVIDVWFSHDCATVWQSFCYNRTLALQK